MQIFAESTLIPRRCQRNPVADLNKNRRLCSFRVELQRLVEVDKTAEEMRVRGCLFTSLFSVRKAPRKRQAASGQSAGENEEMFLAFFPCECRTIPYLKRCRLPR